MKYMKWNILMLLTAVGVWLTACSDDEGTPSVTDETGRAIVLDARVADMETRAGQTGTMDYSVLSQTGFGVFAYGPTAADYSPQAAPDLFDGTKVSYIGSVTPAHNPTDIYYYSGNWSYDGDVKYWPSADQVAQKISFFTYAPYVSAEDIDANSSTGITAVTANADEDPKVTYTIGEYLSQCVDLLWGINQTTKLPWKDQTLADTGGPILFTFHHALSAIGFHVQAIIDKDNDLSDFTDESNVAGMLGESGNYKITIKKLTLAGNPGFHRSAVLNLNSTKDGNGKPVANWGGHSGTVEMLTVRNGSVNASFRHPFSSDPIDYSEATDESKATAIMATTSLPGVTQQAQQLLIANTTPGNKEQCFMVIPHTAADYTLTLDWCICGKTLENKYAWIDRQSVINISDLELKSGIKYYLNLVIGLKTLKLNVTAQDWVEEPKEVEVIVEHGTSASSSLVRKRQ